MKKIIAISTIILSFASVSFAFTGSGIFQMAVTACTNPTTPTVTATAGNGKVTIALSSGGSGATSYTIYRGTSSNGESQVHTGVSLPYDDTNSGTGLTAGTLYYFKVTADNACGSSSQSSEVSATPTTIWTNNVGKWALASTTYTDASSSGNNLTASGSPTAATGHGGTASAATNFSNSPYLYHTDNASLSITGNFTVSMWVYITTGGITQSILSKWNTSQFSYLILLDSYNDVNFNLSANGTAYSTAYSHDLLSVNTWAHIVCVYNGTDMRIYVNGTHTNNGSYDPVSFSSGIKDSTAQFQIGNAQSQSSLFHGRIDDVAIWSRALSSTEITELYNATDDFGGLY